MPYAELLSVSNFSLLHGASHPEELVESAAAEGLSHLGLTDRDAVYGLPRAHKVAKALGVGLLCGATLTVRHRPAVALLVQSTKGWASLCRLLTLARSTQDKGYAQVGVHELAAAAEGLTCVLRPGWQADQAEPLRQAFGDRLEVALSRQLAPGDRQRVGQSVELARRLDVHLVATNDVLMHLPERKPVADVLTCIRRRITLQAAGQHLEPSAERHLLSQAAFQQRYGDFPRAIARATVVAERCVFSLDALQYVYPREVVPQGRTPMGWLRELTFDGLALRYPQGVPERVRAQVGHELDLVGRLDFPAYFLTVHDIVRFARSRGVLCQGRGSAANSAICYALHITAVDPARSSLLFERFISEERGEPPDIDVDFEHERREEVIQYIYSRYGRDRAALVNEVICYRLRSAVRDVGKVFGLSLDQVDRLARCTDRWSAGTGVDPDDLVREAGLDPTDQAVRLTLDLSAQLRGFPRHLSIHVGGFTITDDKLTDIVPVEPASMANRTVIQWDKDDIDTLRFVKVDVLGLGMLTAIRKAFQCIESFWGRPLTLATVPPEDPAVYDMFCRADTVGVFQIESRAQMSMLPRLRPRCFYDLVIEVAIVRPGPIQGGMVHPYLRRRRGEEPVDYAHPALKPILERTLGVPLFQEQVMQMAVAVGGFTAGQADALRRAMGAWRKRGTLEGLGGRLVAGMIDRGISPVYAQQIFEQIKGFGEYGFPESHAASFALLVYISGWLKCHYPAAFCVALINSHPMGFYSPRALVADAQRHGVEVRPVCVASSVYDCTLEPVVGADGQRRSAIRLGFRLIRGMGQDHADQLVRARDDTPFRDVADLARRSQLDRGKLQGLAEADAMSALGLNRRQAAWALQGLWTHLPLFAGLPRREPDPDLPLETPTERLQADYRRVGLSVDTHPMQLVRPHWPELATLDELLERPNGVSVRIAGLVANRQRPGTANGVVFMTLEDETALVNLVVWPKVWARHRSLARRAVLLGADGQLQSLDGAVSVVVHRFWSVDEASPTIRGQSRDFK